MQGLADLQNNLGKHKKKIYSITLVCLLVFSGLLGAFIQFKDSVNVGANPATYVYTETFEDDDTGAVVNGSNPDESWYSVRKYLIGASVWGTYSVSDDGESASQGLHYVCSSSGDATGCYMALNYSGDADIEYINFSYTKVDVASISQVSYIIFCNDSYDYTDHNNHDYETAALALKFDDASGVQKVGYQTNGQTDGTVVYYDNYVYGSWYWFNITFNYTTDKCHLVGNVGNGTHDEGWINFTLNNNLAGLKYIVMYHNSDQAQNFTLDNVILGSNTDLGEEAPGGYPSINGTAFNASLPTTVSGNHSLTFDNDTGSPCWSNSSGTTNETMNITIIDGNSSVTFINISMFNLSDGSGHYINADKIYLYVYNSSAASWVNKSSFPTNGGNISLDNTDTDIGVTWPIAGDDTLLCRFKLVIPGGTTEAVYTQTTLCGVYIGG